MTPIQVVQLLDALETQGEAASALGDVVDDRLLLAFEVEFQALPIANPEKAGEAYRAMANSDRDHCRRFVAGSMANLAAPNPDMAVSIWQDLLIDDNIDTAVFARLCLEEAIRDRQLPPDHTARLIGNLAELYRAFMTGRTDRDLVREWRTAERDARGRGETLPYEP